MGGMVEAIEQGFPQREIAEASYRFQQAVERREKIIVGVNDFVRRTSRRIRSSTSTNRPPSGRWPSWRSSGRRATTTGSRARSTRCERPRAGDGNTMYPLLDCVRAYATVGEMCDALREVWGEYEEVPSI